MIERRRRREKEERKRERNRKREEIRVNEAVNDDTSVALFKSLSHRK